MSTAIAFVAGMLFAVGLGLGGMTQPAKVLAFLDVAGRWDPSLAFVLVGAIAVHAPLARAVFRRGAPFLAPDFKVPTRRDLDAPLLAGAAIFGIGWGLAGYCPGPALVSLVAGSDVVVFVAAMIAGMTVARRYSSSSGR